MYDDLLNVYGDRGNVLILKSILEALGIKCNVERVSVGHPFNYRECDILFMGGGQDYEQITVGADLIASKKNSLKTYIENGGCGLYVCGSYQLLGKSYVAADGRRIEGVGILNIFTKQGQERFIGNIVIYSPVLKARLLGFENHSGRTYINGYTPLGRVLVGSGNNGIDKTEGLIYKNTICTYMHGPCLSKNPEIARFLITNAIKRKYGKSLRIDLNDTLFAAAKKDMLKKLHLGK